MEQLQRAALHDVAIGLPQKCRTIGVAPTLPRGTTAQRFCPIAERFQPGGAATNSPVERRILIRAGRLKTCWTKPLGPASPQLWALQPGEELGMGETAIAKRGYNRVVRDSCGVGQMSEGRDEPKLP